MPELAARRYWLVGASEGLGRSLAQALDAEGAALVLSARNAEKLATLAGELRDARIAPLDVTDPQSVSNAAEIASDCDGIIYCAGAYDPISATEWDAAAVRQMAEVNYLGALDALGALMPSIVAQGRGHIVLIGSLAGHRGLPGAIGYGSSKAALMHLAENLRIDLRGTDIKVQQINPGFIRTRLTAKNDFNMPQIMTPEGAAAHVMKAMKSRRFSTSFPTPFAWLFVLGRYLPLKLFQWLF